MLVILRVFLIIVFSTQLWASNTSSSWYFQNSDQKVQINVEMFLSSTCPHCQKADAFFHEIEPNTPWLHVQRNYINEDKGALDRFNQLLTQLKFDDFAVPSVFFCGSRWVGFDSAQNSGKDMFSAIQYCKNQIEKQGTLAPTTINTLKRWANANLYNSGVTEHLSNINYLLFVVLLDVFNSCSLFCLAGFFAVLFIQDNRKNQMISGLLFILATSLAHYFQQTQASLFFQIMPWLRGFIVLLGFGSLYLAVCHYRKQIIKPYVLFVWSFLWALMLQAYQQACIMNWSYIFQQWLYNQTLSNGKRDFLQLLYQGLYIAPLVITLFVYLMIINTRYFNHLKLRLDTIGVLYLIIIALLLISYPLALSYYLSSFVILLGLTIGGWFLSRFYEERQKRENK